MPNVKEHWRGWYSGAYDPPPLIGYVGSFWLNTLSDGVWEKVSSYAWVLRGYLGTSTLFSAGVVFVPFTASDWSNDRITVIPLGVPAHGEVGPHIIPPRYIMSSVMALDGSYSREIGLDIIFDYTTGRINIFKTSLVKPFAGVVELRFKL
jgi:hypothetical protein